MKVLIDTNVVMDALEGAGEFFDASNKAIEDTQFDLFHVLRDIKELAECYKLESAVAKENRQWSQRARKRQKSGT